MVSIPDFARGPDQAINIPATSSGLPIRIDNADGVRSIDFTLPFDPTLLDVTSISKAPGMPGDWSINYTINEDNIVVTMWTSDPAGLAPGPRDLAVITASVLLRAEAPYGYGSTGLLKFESLSLNGGLIGATPDVAVYKTAYIGDATGNRTYSSLDASRISRVVVGIDSGFDPYDLTDPFILANVHDNGVLDGMDISLFHAEAIGIDQLEVPDLPGTLPPGSVDGPDPVVTVPAGVTIDAGGSGVLVLTIDETGGLQALDFTIDYDTSLLDVSNIDIALGDLLSSGGWTLGPNVNDAAGRITIGAFRNNPMASQSGAILEITVHAPVETSGQSDLDLEGLLNEGELALTPIDGSVNIIDPNGSVTVETVAINSGQAQRSRIDSILMTLSGPASLSAGDLALHNDSTDENFLLDAVPFDDSTDTWDLSPLALTDGRYTATLSAPGVETHEFSFHVLRATQTVMRLSATATMTRSRTSLACAAPGCWPTTTTTARSASATS